MIPDSKYVSEKIELFNSSIFSNELPPVTVKISKAKSYLGKMEYKFIRGFFGRIKGARDFVMRISSAFDLQESVQEDVIIHELIHCYLAFKGIRDNSAHGKEFRRMMKEINAKTGRSIKISYKINALTCEDDPLQTSVPCLCDADSA